MSSRKFSNIPTVWKPKQDADYASKKFKQLIEEKYNISFGDYWDFHKWSIENFENFWAELWHYIGIVYSKRFSKVIDLNVSMSEGPEWFSGARLNYAENLLKYRDEHVAIIAAGEEKEPKYITYTELYKEACVYTAALKKLGVQKGDRVVCIMSNREEAIIAMLATTSIGAIWSGVLPLMGAQAIINRLKQIEPKILFTMDRFLQGGQENEMLSKVEVIAAGLTSLEKVIIVPSKEESKKKDISKIRASCFLDDFLKLGYNADGSVEEMKFEQLPFNYPVFISYTSGTTGLPKALIHDCGCLLTVTRDFWLLINGKRENVWLSMSPAGWISWNVLATVHFFGVTVVLFEGLPFFLSPTYIWDMVDELNISHLFLPPSILDNLQKNKYLPTEKHRLNSLSYILSGGSVVKPKNFDFAYEILDPDCVFFPVYGSTELMGSCMIHDRSLPIYKGEVTAPSLGNDVQFYDELGKPLNNGEIGNIVLTKPTPSLSLGIWGDTDGSLFKQTYYNKYPDAFAMGDLGLRNPVTRGVIVCGRSDDTLKQRGCRFGSSDIYNVLEIFPEIQDSLCVSQYNKDLEERAVLFIKTKNECDFNEELVSQMRTAISQELSVRHVPEVILPAEDIPHNFNGKKMEIVVKNIINHRPYDPETARNPECLRNFIDIPELQGF